MFNLSLKITILKILGAGVLFLVIYTLSKKMPLHEYGIYETLIRISLLISTFSIFGSSVLITRAKSFYTAKKLFLKTFPTILSINGILVIISILVVYLFVEEYVGGIIIILSGLLYTTYKSRGALSLKKKKYFISILSDDVLFNVLMAILLSIILFMNVTLKLFTVSIIVFVSRALTLLILNMNFKLRSLRVKQGISLLKESATLFKQTFAQKLVNNLPVIMCPLLFSGNDLGIFALSVRLSGIYLIALSGFIVFITPNISEKISQDNFIASINTALKMFALIAVCILAINIIFSNYIVAIWEDFEGYIYIYLIILVGHLVNFAVGFSGVILNQSGLEKKHLSVNLLSLLLLLTTFIISYIFESFLVYVMLISSIMIIENILKLRYLKDSLK